MSGLGGVAGSGSLWRPGWVCSENLAVGSAIPHSDWVWGHFSHSLLCTLGVPQQTEQRDFGKEKLDSEFGSPRER